MGNCHTEAKMEPKILDSLSNVPNLVDKAYVCAGSCKAAVTHPQQCGDLRCTMFRAPLKEVDVVYHCSKGVCEESSCPALHRPDCSLRGSCLLAKAVVPRNLQFPLLDPPESNRKYSSVWGEDDSHAKSTLDSALAWCAKTNDVNQWAIIDAGRIMDSIGGIVISTRKENHQNQFVTKVAIDVAVEDDNEDSWVSMFDGPCDTKLTKNDCTGVVAIPFQRPVAARFVRIRPLEWESHISLRCALILAGEAREQFFLTTTENEYRDLVDVNQLPAKVPITYIPGGLPRPQTSTSSAGDSFAVLHAPDGKGEWCGRKMSWEVLKFNDRNTQERVFATSPGARCSIEVQVQTRWSYNRNDYCPGCIVQLYYGIDSVFSEGIIEFGIHNDHRSSRKEFIAPTTPGLYYITQNISLEYHYVTVHHSNSPNGAIAAIRVLPTKFEESSFAVLPRLWQDQFRALLVFWSRQGDQSTVFSGLARENLYMIFSFVMDLQRDDL